MSEKYHIKVYRVESGKWTLDHALADFESNDLAEASTVANGYNTRAAADCDSDPWPLVAVAVPVEDQP